MITNGANTASASEEVTKMVNKILNRLAVMSHASRSPRLLRTSEKIGIKAAVTAPSARIFRWTLGMRKATKNASAAAVAPNCMAITRSRRNPSRRETRVMLPTVPAAWPTFLLFSIELNECRTDKLRNGIQVG